MAVGYGETLNWLALALGTLVVAAVAGLARLGIRSVPIYFLFGVLIWLCFDASGKPDGNQDQCGGEQTEDDIPKLKTPPVLLQLLAPLRQRREVRASGAASGRRRPAIPNFIRPPATFGLC